MLNILCTGHGTSSIGCGYDFYVSDIEVDNAVLAICPSCGTKTDLEKTYESDRETNCTTE